MFILSGLGLLWGGLSGGAGLKGRYSRILEISSGSCWILVQFIAFISTPSAILSTLPLSPINPTTGALFLLLPPNHHYYF